MMHAARAVPMLGLPVGWARLGISRGEDASVVLSMLGLPGRMGRLGSYPRLGSTVDPNRRQRGTLQQYVAVAPVRELRILVYLRHYGPCCLCLELFVYVVFVACAWIAMEL